MLADTLHIARSRESILGAIGAAPDLALVVVTRDWGDKLSAAGAKALLKGRRYRELGLEQLAGARGDTVLLMGPGFSRRECDRMPRTLAVAELRFRRVIVLPCSFDISEDAVERVLTRTRATIFASDPESYRQISPVCDARLAHDCVFFVDFPPMDHLSTGELDACVDHQEQNDPSEIIETIAGHELVRTDSGRLLIASALMGKRVEYVRGSDHELAAIAKGIFDGYPLTEILPKPEPPIGPAALDDATQRTLEQLRDSASLSPPSPRAQSGSSVRISAVVLTRGRPSLLYRALQSIEDSRASVRTIVIDNNSPPIEAELVRSVCAAHANAEVWRSERNLGCAGGRCLGISLADTELVLFLDDDCELLPGALEHLVAELDEHPEAAAATSTVIRPDGTVMHSGGRVEATDEIVTFELLGDGSPFTTAELPPSGSSDWLPLGAALIRRSLLEEFPIDEGMERYFEDNEWSYRVSRSRSGSFRRSPRSVVLHHLAPKHEFGRDFVSSSRTVELLASYARFYQRTGRLLGPWLFDHVPELRAADGSWDLAGGRLLMELVIAKGTDWIFTEWMNGGLAGLLTGRAVRLDRQNLQRRVEDLERTAEDLERTAEDLGREGERLGREVSVLEGQGAMLRARTARDADTIAELDRSLSDVNRKLLRVEGSVTWQLFQRVRRRTFDLLGGEESANVAALQRSLRATGRALRLSHSASPGWTVPAKPVVPSRVSEITLPSSEAPDVSIIIPVYSHAELTRAALQSIADNTSHVGYEVIVVDDVADRGTKELLRKLRGARVCVNQSNLGYLRSVQRGAGEARGRWLVLCNNDIEVQPGWLAALLECGESAEDIAIVAPKFLAPDGSLSEAGAIIWRDGTGANYGRGEHPGCCHYEYRREIDYGSAAALLVRKDFWEEVGGFDERFLPMYYEDTDLCFEARRRELRVMYEPCARVIHVEGATAGTDANASHKRHQEANRPKFVAKWQRVLSTDHLANDPRDLWLAANRHRRPHVLIADHRVPTWDRDSGGLRMRGLIEALIDLGCKVTLVPDNLAAIQPYTREFQRLGVEVIYNVDIRATLGIIGPTLSLAILSRPQVASHWLQLVRETAPTAIVAYDTVDLHWVREARRAALAQGNGVRAPAMEPKVKAMRELELALIRATDVTLVVTDEERLQVLADEPKAIVEVLPNVNKVRITVPPAAERSGVVFVGGFEHPPNTDGALMLVREVMPLVWKRLGPVPVTIVGPDPPPEVQRLASQLVSVVGWVHDLDSVLDCARALVAPLRYGAGMKGKVTQAMAAGLPVVTTPIGAEGLSTVDGEYLLIGGDAGELAERVVRLLEDGELWQRLSRAGQQMATERFSAAVVSERLGELLERAMSHPPVPVAVTSG